MYLPNSNIFFCMLQRLLVLEGYISCFGFFYLFFAQVDGAFDWNVIPVVYAMISSYTHFMVPFVFLASSY